VSLRDAFGLLIFRGHYFHPGGVSSFYGGFQLPETDRYSDMLTPSFALTRRKLRPSLWFAAWKERCVAPADLVGILNGVVFDESEKILISRRRFVKI